jgi:hypothetical protein
MTHKEAIWKYVQSKTEEVKAIDFREAYCVILVHEMTDETRMHIERSLRTYFFLKLAVVTFTTKRYLEALHLMEYKVAADDRMKEALIRSHMMVIDAYLRQTSSSQR